MRAALDWPSPMGGMRRVRSALPLAKMQRWFRISFQAMWRLLRQENNWEKLAGGEPTGWANASHRYAVRAQAPNGAMLMKDYVAEETRVVDSELALGGLRLGWGWRAL